MFISFVHSSPILKNLRKYRLFRSNHAKTSESLRLCRFFKLFHPGIEIRSRKDAQSQAFPYFPYFQDEKDAYSQELGEIYGREEQLPAWAILKRLKSTKLGMFPLIPAVFSSKAAHFRMKKAARSRFIYLRDSPKYSVDLLQRHANFLCSYPVNKTMSLMKHRPVMC
ncbi:hypothetical protein BC351_33795 [Paenibacillus ferrarius]|uniref:Uncharacterized protein n=1 Tax=Paenibacillus ferrarius TaxID=1469647 RepID=A0A1V4HE24_9BACL|nr:hypothetical protein BC351_33795 [Paenibacillus ferrarius]